jgi:tRNA modification GTPase
LGLHLTSAWRVVVVGAPNVGKSSLINALAGYDRAIVSPTPGTTRDVVTVKTAIDGWPVQLSDTAGFRETQDELESAGIELATRALSSADLAIFVHDASRLSDQTNLETSTPASHQRAIHVVNKIDLVAAGERTQVFGRFVASRPDIARPLAISALDGEGIGDLISAIARALVPVSVSAGSAVPFTSEQFDGLAAAKSAIDKQDAAAATAFLQALLTKTSR